MDISLAGIEEAVGGLGYRETSLKARLIRTIQKFYGNSGAPDKVHTIDSDELIDLMWDLGGDRKAIRSRRKNLSSIKSSVNHDLDIAWEAGRNPEGITIGPLNTFVMSDAAKDRILNSFSGSMNLEGGNSLDRVAEALKIVSDFLSETPSDVENEQLSNLKSLIEGLSDKFREGGGEIKIVEKTVEDSGDMVGDDIEEGVEEVPDDLVEVLEDIEDEPETESGETGGDGDADVEVDDADALEFVDEDEIYEEAPDELIELEGEGYSDGDGDVGEEAGEEEGDENVVELLGAEGLEDADEVQIVYEDETDDMEAAQDAETDTSGDEGDDEVELVDDDMAAEPEAPDEVLEDFEDAGGDEADDMEAVAEEGALVEENGDLPVETEDEIALDDAVDALADDIEFVDEEDLIEAAEDGPEEVDEMDAYDAVEMDGEEDAVELVGAEGLEEADEVELLDEDELIEAEDGGVDDAEEDAEIEEVSEEEADDLEDEVEVMEEEVDGAADDTAADEDAPGEEVGLPIDQIMEDAQNFEEFQLDEKQKRLLAEQFDGYLGAMERYYNQYIFIKKGSYLVGADKAEEDVLSEQQILMADYYMGKYPVTNALFEVFIERTGYKTTAEKLGYGYVYHGRFRKVVDPNTGFTSSIWNSTYTREKVMGATWYQPLGPGSTLHKKRNHPVVQVSIRDARTFAAWTGKRLPSEIEWEAAARTQAGFRFPWGNEWIEGFCNFENSGISDTCPVDHFPHSANETGLADLSGNVMEWTSDECEPKYPLETPTRFYIAKGGSWISPEQTTLHNRSRFEADFTSNILGFRCLAD